MAKKVLEHVEEQGGTSLRDDILQMLKLLVKPAEFAKLSEEIALDWEEQEQRDNDLDPATS